MQADPFRGRWPEVDALFRAALDLPAQERHAFVASRAGSDAELCELVTGLLPSAERPDTFLDDRSIIAAAAAELAAFEDADVAGHRLGAYELVRTIGEGGGGTVYEATRADGAFQRRVAIKLLRRGFDTEDVLERFRRERQILSALDHPGIARLYDGGASADGRPWFVMQYVDGVPITRHCADAGVDTGRRVELIADVARALAYAHQRGIVHRDIKPGNVLVTAGGAVHVVDFGIARLLGGDASPAEPLTVAGVRLLTPRYASPEQLAGGRITPATDVFQLGALLYELLTGAPPPGPGTAGADGLVAALAATSEPGIRRAELSAMVLKALRPEPDRRYPSADAFLDDLERYLDGRPVAARRRAAARRLVPGRRAALATGIATAAVGLWLATIDRTASDAVAPATTPMAIGTIVVDGDVDGQLARSLGAMLAATVARVPGVHVVTSARMAEILAGDGTPAGETGVIEGTLIEGTLSGAGEALALELRAIDPATGAVRERYHAEGGNAFTLVSRASEQLLAALGTPLPDGIPADVVTTSLLAYRLWEEALTAWSAGDTATAHRLVDAAVTEDPGFRTRAPHPLLTGRTTPR